MLSECDRAVNCERWTDETELVRPRFKKGMEPGSADFEKRMALVKRDSDAVSTSFAVNDNQLTWGCNIDPVQTINNLSSICFDGSCPGDPWSQTVTYVPAAPGSVAHGQPGYTLEISVVDGHYPTWWRNGMIQSIQDVMASPKFITWDKNQGWEEHNYKRDNAPGVDPQPGTSGYCDVATTTTGISLTTTHGDALFAILDIKISIADGAPGFCAAAGILNTGGTLLGAIPGLGAVLAGAMGTITAVCGMPS